MRCACLGKLAGELRRLRGQRRRAATMASGPRPPPMGDYLRRPALSAAGAGAAGRRREGEAATVAARRGEPATLVCNLAALAFAVGRFRVGGGMIPRLLACAALSGRFTGNFGLILARRFSA